MGISIKEPCTEDWAKMSATQQGAFCQKCAHEVIDFTGKSSLEIKSILAQKISEDTRVCGRIQNRQLAEINEEFVGWKNAQEEVNAIWILSLIAVFGLTLFSCSNTLSKEMVNQIAIVSNDIVAEDSLQNIVNDPLVAKVKDTIEVNKEYKVAIQEGWTMGIMPQEISVIPAPWLICGITLGFTSIQGDIISTPELKPWMIEKYLEPVAVSEPPIVPLVNQFVAPISNQATTNSLNGILGSFKIFEVEVSPLPLVEESKLYLNVFQSAEIHFLLKEAETKKEIFRSKDKFIEGEYILALRFDEITKGNYVLFVSADNQEERIVFEV